MRHYIGIDGGGTKTKCILADENFTIISEATGGPSNFLVYGTEEVAGTLLKVIQTVLDSASMNFDDIYAILLGTAGAGRRNDAEMMENEFRNLCGSKGISCSNFRVESDARIALEGAFSGQPGSILIAGTGSIMFGKDRNGNIHRVGGFGRFIGDEGSGYMIGRKGLMAVAKEFDGRGQKTLLTEALEEAFHIADSATLISEIYKNKFDIASVTPLVIKAAEQGDSICSRIIEEESEELISHIHCMYNLLDEEILKVSLIGSTIITDNFYAKTFNRKINENLKNVILCEPQLPPAMGAVVMAKTIFS